MTARLYVSTDPSKRKGLSSYIEIECTCGYYRNEFSSPTIKKSGKRLNARWSMWRRCKDTVKLVRPRGNFEKQISSSKFYDEVKHIYPGTIVQSA